MTDTQWSEALSDVELDALYMSTAAFNEISEGSDLLRELSGAEAIFMFEGALEHGSHMRLWFDRATALDEAAAWQIVDDRISNENARIEQAENAIKLLGEIRSATALEYLKKATLQDALASSAVQALAGMRTKEALSVLEEALHQDRLADLVIDSLGQVKTTDAVDLLGLALEQSAFAAQAAITLERISKGRTSPSANRAKQVLDKWRQVVQDQSQLSSEKDVVPQSSRSGERTTIKERDWEVIVRRIRSGKCAPILGPTSSPEVVSSSASLAKQWARKYDYPLKDDTDLSLVAEFVSAEVGDSSYVYELLRTAYERIALPHSIEGNDIIGLLADLPLPVYITATYDDLMFQALEARGRSPKLEICRWKRSLADEPSVTAGDFSPSLANPLVFHLFGHISVPESLVITFGDYLEFLVNSSRESNLIPRQVQKVLTGSSLLLLGFSFFELRTRVLLATVDNALRSSLSKVHLAVLNGTSTDDSTEDQKAKTQTYLDRHFGNRDFRTYWGTVKEFSAELRQRWDGSGHNP
jgi:hypothetical protein